MALKMCWLISLKLAGLEAEIISSRLDIAAIYGKFPSCSVGSIAWLKMLNFNFSYNYFAIFVGEIVEIFSQFDFTSNAMIDYELKDIDSEDIGDLHVEVEPSIDSKFIGDELYHITTFGRLCDHITNKIQLDNSANCESQQAFYKLRDAISSTLQIDSKAISTDFPLSYLLLIQSRRSMTKKLEKYLDFKLNILRPPHWVIGTIIILLFTSIVGLFFNWQIGLLGLTISIAGTWFANKIGNELGLQTVGQVAEKMLIENYLKTKRNPKTFNKKEIEKVLVDWFSNCFDLDKSILTKDAKFV